MFESYLEGIVTISILGKHDNIPAESLNHLVFHVGKIEFLNGVLHNR
jgi:hypothetical protein